MSRRRHRRPEKWLWRTIRREVWQRDRGCCVRCVFEGAPQPEVLLRQAHIDHILPLSKGGNNTLENLRTLCRKHHVLRKDSAHRNMIARALNDGVIPFNWRDLVWE